MKDKPSHPVHLCDNCKNAFIDSGSINGMTYYREQICRVHQMTVTRYSDAMTIHQCKEFRGVTNQ